VDFLISFPYPWLLTWVMYFHGLPFHVLDFQSQVDMGLSILSPFFTSFSFPSFVLVLFFLFFLSLHRHISLHLTQLELSYEFIDESASHQRNFQVRNTPSEGRKIRTKVRNAQSAYSFCFLLSQSEHATLQSDSLVTTLSAILLHTAYLFLDCSKPHWHVIFIVWSKSSGFSILEACSRCCCCGCYCWRGSGGTVRSISHFTLLVGVNNSNIIWEDIYTYMKT